MKIDNGLKCVECDMTDCEYSKNGYCNCTSINLEKTELMRYECKSIKRKDKDPNNLIQEIIKITEQLDIFKRECYYKYKHSNSKEDYSKFEAYEKSYDLLLDLLNDCGIEYKGVKYSEYK